jgi:transposase
MVAANACTALTFSLSPGQAGDAPAGRELLRTLSGLPKRCRLIMDKAYEGNETRQLALDLGFVPVVPPLSTRVDPWTYSKAWYRRRNEIERLFRRLKASAASLAASTSSTSCLWRSCASRSSLKHSVSVNSP